MGRGLDQCVSVAAMEVEGVAVESMEMEAGHQCTIDRVGRVAATDTIQKPTGLARGAADLDACDGSGQRIAGALVLAISRRPEGLVEPPKLPYGIEAATFGQRRTGLVDVDVARFTDAASGARLSTGRAGELVAERLAERCASLKLTMRPTDVNLICQKTTTEGPILF